MNYFKQTFKYSRFFLLAGAVAFSASSCNTETDDDDTTPTTPPTATPTIEDGYGSLSAVKTVTFQDIPGFGQIEIDLGLAVGAFFNGTDYSSFVSAGTVSCEGSELTMNANNSYTFTPSQTNATGIDFSGNPDWVVGGNGDIPAFTHTTNIGFPTTGAITSASTVTAANGYTLSCANVAGADSVLFMVGGVVATEMGNATSHTFTAADLANVGTGSSVVQVAAYKIEEQIFSGKGFWFVNERVVTQTVTLE
ncbi:MAG: hypothetical protein JKX84_04555 [Flavobacteriales bacterium]|nr:hypothetical protein [Flavobacteriales bacterium]